MKKKTNSFRILTNFLTISQNKSCLFICQVFCGVSANSSQIVLLGNFVSAAPIEVSWTIMKPHPTWGESSDNQTPSRPGIHLLEFDQCILFECTRPGIIQKIVAHFYQWDFVCNQQRITLNHFAWYRPLAQLRSVGLQLNWWKKYRKNKINMIKLDLLTPYVLTI